MGCRDRAGSWWGLGSPSPRESPLLRSLDDAPQHRQGSERGSDILQVTQQGVEEPGLELRGWNWREAMRGVYVFITLSARPLQYLFKGHSRSPLSAFQFLCL